VPKRSGLRWSEQNHAEWKDREAQRAIPVVGECNAQDKPRPALKLTRPEIPEAAVLDAVLKALDAHPKVAWAARMNSGAGKFQYPDGSTSQFLRFGFKGMSDVLGMTTDHYGGRLLAIEVKRPTGRATADQVAFLETVRRNGGIAFIARSVDDVLRELQWL
jgi:hypothetical protein